MHRPVDRIEARSILAMLAVLMIAGPVIACTAGWHVYRRGVAVERVEQSQRFRNQAVLVHDTATTNTTYSPGGVATVSVDARWSAPDGTTISGSITVAAGTPAGAVVTLWTDAQGRPLDAPRSRAHTVRQAILAGVVAAVGLVLLLATARLVIRRILDHYRLAAWQAEWLAVEPQWTGRR
jgi:hypothetical protein